MTYEFSWTWFGIGFLILLAGAALTVWYRQVADNLGSGVSSYERYKLWGLMGCGIGLLTMLNLHTLILNMLIGGLFHR